MNNSRSVLSNVRRSTSVRRGAYEYDVERVSPILSNYQKTRKSTNIASGDRRKTNLVRNQGGTLQRTSLQSASSCHSVTAASDDSVTSLRIPSWDDEISTGSMSEAEEKTIKAVCEQMKGCCTGSVTPTSEIYETVRSEVQRAISGIQDDLQNSIRRSNATGIATADVTSIAPDSVKPGAVELVLDIRREYATKLEEKREENLDKRIHELRKELDAGEQAVKQRKGTLNVVKLIKDGGDIKTTQAAEDAYVNSFRDARLMGSISSLPEATPSILPANGPSNCPNHKKSMHDAKDSVLTANVSPLVSAIDGGDKNADSGRKSQFSLAREPTLTTGLQQEIKIFRIFLLYSAIDGGDKI